MCRKNVFKMSAYREQEEKEKLEKTSTKGEGADDKVAAARISFN